MGKPCKKCGQEKNESEFSEFVAVCKEGKIKKKRTICYSCIYQKRFYKKFHWPNATKKQILKRLQDRFEKYVIKKDGCWEWNGFIRPDGYTRMRIGNGSLKKSVGGHVVSWMVHNKKIKLSDFMKDKFYILHSCDNRVCTNPDHLFLGNCRSNMIDMVIKKRHPNIKLTLQQVKQIKRKFKNGAKIREISREYNINETTIADIKHNRTWKHVIIN